MHPFVARYSSSAPHVGADGGVALPSQAATAIDYTRDAFILGTSVLLVYLTLSIKVPTARR
jgi:hypothetical protein